MKKELTSKLLYLDFLFYVGALEAKDEIIMIKLMLKHISNNLDKLDIRIVETLYKYYGTKNNKI